MRELLVVKHIVIAFVFAVSCVLPLATHADNPSQGPYEAPCVGAGGFVPLECFQRSAKLTDAYTTQDLKPFLQKLFVGAISLGAILAVLRLAYAGFQYMGSEQWSSKEHAKETIRETLLGLFLLISIWLILNQINPDILKLNVETKAPPSSGTSGAAVTGVGSAPY